MQKIGPMLANALLQIDDGARQLGPLVPQGSDNMRFSHITYPLENPGICSPPRRHLTSWYGWRLLHKTVQFRSGARRSEVMNVVAKPVTDAEIEALANYYEGLKPGGS
jgi:hypothetical protein